MSTVINRRNAALLAAIGASTFALLASAPPAHASTLYACVKKNGAARLFVRKPRCRRSERRLSWNVEGPQGPRGRNGATGKNGRNGTNGINGMNGANGTNGAAAGFSASSEVLKSIGEAAEVKIVGRTLPAGSYIVSAKAVVIASAAKSEPRYGASCELLEGAAALDSAQFVGPLAEVSPTSFVGSTTLTVEAAITIKAPTEVSLLCSGKRPNAEVGIEAGFAQLVAVQTALNS